MTGERKSVKSLDAVELYQADFLYRRDSVFNAESYLAFLGQIAHRYRRQGAVLIQDNASYHKDAAVWAWFADNRHRLEVHQLPSYCPELNPTEQQELVGTLTRVFHKIQAPSAQREHKRLHLGTVMKSLDINKIFTFIAFRDEDQRCQPAAGPGVQPCRNPAT